MIFPIKTIWTRDEGWRVPEGEIKPTDMRWTFSGALGVPLPNPFGPDKKAVYNKTVTVEDFSLQIHYATWNKGEISLYMSLLQVPQGGMATAWPLVAIVVAVATITGLALLIVLLSKIEAILNIPTTWIIVGGAGLLLFPFMARNIRKAVPG